MKQSSSEAMKLSNNSGFTKVYVSNKYVQKIVHPLKFTDIHGLRRTLAQLI